VELLIEEPVVLDIEIFVMMGRQAHGGEGDHEENEAIFQPTWLLRPLACQGRSISKLGSEIQSPAKSNAFRAILSLTYRRL
jgi:hypothetical protein